MHIRKNPWDYLLPYAVTVFGPDVLNKEKRAAWCKAMFCAGSTLCLWNRAVELKLALLSACALREGQRVLLIGKYANESGLASAIGSLLGGEGSLRIEEIASKALVSFSEVHPVTGKRLQWDFSNFDSLPDKSVDRVILFGAASHMGNLHHCAQHIHRVLRDGGKVIAADLQEGMLEIVRNKIRGTDIESRVELHKCEDDSIGVKEKVDLVVAFFVVHELPDKEKALKELKSILKPGGKVYINEFLMHPPKDKFGEMVDVARSLGFVEVERHRFLISRAIILK